MGAVGVNRTISAHLRAPPHIAHVSVSVCARRKSLSSLTCDYISVTHPKSAPGHPYKSGPDTWGTNRHQHKRRTHTLHSRTGFKVQHFEHLSSGDDGDGVCEPKERLLHQAPLRECECVHVCDQCHTCRPRAPIRTCLNSRTSTHGRRSSTIQNTHTRARNIVVDYFMPSALNWDACMQNEGRGRRAGG